MVKITDVTPGSAAHRKGIAAGDLLLEIDGNPIRDLLDYRFYITEPKLLLTLSRGGESYTVTLSKPRYDDIGLEFASYLMDEPKHCANNCVFCFIDQNPPGMRPTIYFKDDDERMGFLHGNYVTLTNLTMADVQRIVKYRISPVNVSVHTCNPALRVQMMGNPHAGEVLRYLDILAKGEIDINAQIVLCRGINDGAELDFTLHELYQLYPSLNSVSIVPAGLTRHREGCPPMQDFTREDVLGLIEQVRAYADGCLKLHKKRLFYLADEFYIRAGLPIPDYESYDDFPQLENGVGLIAALTREVEEALLEPPKARFRGERHITIATGSAAYQTIRGLAEKICAAYSDLRIDVREIKNDFYGHSVTVAGLVCGGDMIAQLAPFQGCMGEELYIPDVMLRHEGDLFLDGVTPAEITAALGIPVTVLPPSGYELVDAAASAGKYNKT